MLLPLDERERIRRAYHIERKSIRQIARETGHCRDAIRKAIMMIPSQMKPCPSIPSLDLLPSLALFNLASMPC